MEHCPNLCGRIVIDGTAKVFHVPLGSRADFSGFLHAHSGHPQTRVGQLTDGLFLFLDFRSVLIEGFAISQDSVGGCPERVLEPANYRYDGADRGDYSSTGTDQKQCLGIGTDGAWP